MLKSVIKLLLFPVMWLLWLIECVCAAAARISGIVFHLVGDVIILFAVLSYGLGLEPWAVVVRMIFGGIVFLAIPLVGTVLITGISLLRIYIRTL